MKLIGLAFRSSLLAGLLVLSGCSLWPWSNSTPLATEPPGSVTYVITFEADEDINRDSSGRAMPVLLNIFELRGAGNFEMSDYFDLRDKAQARLGQDFLRGDQLMIWPGATEQRSYTSVSAPEQIGVVAGYQQLEGRTWRLLLPLKDVPLPDTSQLDETALPEGLLPGRHLRVGIRQDGLHIQPILQDSSRTDP
ncbi:type VI secretion system lipoprotein TssJ [Pseudomonas nicosulfuronedens]